MTPGPSQRVAARQLHLAEDGPQQRGLAGAVRADDGEPVLPCHLEVDRAEPERAELDHRLIEPGDHVAAAGGRLQLELELPRLPRLVDDLEPLDGLLGGLDLGGHLLGALGLEVREELVVVGLLRLGVLHPDDGPLALRLLPRLQAVALGAVLLVALLLLPTGQLPRLDEVAPPAGVLHGVVVGQAQLEDAVDRCGRGTSGRATRRRPRPASTPRTARAGRARRSRGRWSARRAAARPAATAGSRPAPRARPARRDRWPTATSSRSAGSPTSASTAPRARLEVVAADGEVVLERRAVGLDRRPVVTERVHRGVERPRGRRHAGPPSQVVAQRLAGVGVGLLRQEARRSSSTATGRPNPRRAPPARPAPAAASTSRSRSAPRCPAARQGSRRATRPRAPPAPRGGAARPSPPARDPTLPAQLPTSACRKWVRHGGP